MKFCVEAWVLSGQAWSQSVHWPSISYALYKGASVFASSVSMGGSAFQTYFCMWWSLFRVRLSFRAVGSGQGGLPNAHRIKLWARNLRYFFDYISCVFRVPRFRIPVSAAWGFASHGLDPSHTKAFYVLQSTTLFKLNGGETPSSTIKGDVNCPDFLGVCRIWGAPPRQAHTSPTGGKYKIPMVLAAKLHIYLQRPFQWDCFLGSSLGCDKLDTGCSCEKVSDFQYTGAVERPMPAPECQSNQ